MPINNVFFYVMDSLRWDATPEQIQDNGLVFKTVSQSLFSAPSFATLATGRYPPHHGVHNWTDRMPADTPTIFDIDGVQSGFWQRGPTGGQAIFPILQQDGKTEMGDLDPPFVYLERNTFPHVPYTGTDAETAKEYWSTRGTDWERIRNEYKGGIRRSVRELDARLGELADRDLLDETLVIVTSDHGELFGEHGEVAHGTPACPELVYVPTVFIHPSLSASDFHADPNAGIIEHVDIVQTLLSALGHSDVVDTDGTDLLRAERPRPWGYNHIDIVRSGRSMYAAESLWWCDGGYVFAQNTRVYRTIYAIYQLLQGASRKSVRGSPAELLGTYIPQHTSYGSPPIHNEQAREMLRQFREQLDRIESRSVELDEDTNELLESLGYR